MYIYIYIESIPYNGVSALCTLTKTTKKWGPFFKVVDLLAWLQGRAIIFPQVVGTPQSMDMFQVPQHFPFSIGAFHKKCEEKISFTPFPYEKCWGVDWLHNKT